MRLSGAEAGRRLCAHGDDPLGATARDGPPSQRALQNDYYRYIDAGPRPSIVVIQDLDGAQAGYGAFWGEVQSAIHAGLGVRGLVTNGSVRDLDQWAPGFQFLAATGRAVARVCEAGGVRHRGEGVRHAVRPGDLSMPIATARWSCRRRSCAASPEAARAVAAREARILAVARAPGCTARKLIAVFARSGSISLSAAQYDAQARRRTDQTSRTTEETTMADHPSEKQRRRLLQAGLCAAALGAVPGAGQFSAHAQGAFDWKKFKGEKIEVFLVKSPRGDLLPSTTRNSRT